MAFKRYNGTVEPFAIDATGSNRTVFGDTLQSDDIDDNLNSSFKKGWEIVGINDNPTKQDFNGLAYTVSNLVAYLYQQGIAEYNSSQKYMLNSIVIASNGKLYMSLTGDEAAPNVGNDPITDTVNWKNLSEGDNTQRFKVADAVNDDEALSKGQLPAEINEIDGLDADLLDGKHAVEFNRQIDTSLADVGPGWMTVAENISGRFQGDIIVSDSDSGDNSYIKIHWMRSLSDSNFTVITCGGYRNRITGVRVLYDTSDNMNGKKILQVYATVKSKYRVNIFKDGNIYSWNGHTAVTPVIQNTLTGYSIHGHELTELDAYSLASEEGIIAGGNIKAPRFIGVADKADDADKVDGIPGALLGIGGAGYSWVDEKANRTLGTTYTNTTGKPILVSVVLSSAATNQFQRGYVNDANVSTARTPNATNGSYFYMTIVLLVPHKSTYKVTGGSISEWKELK